MGVGEGIFNMTNSKTKAIDSPNLPEQSISLDEAYAQSGIQDKLMAVDFDAFLNDGLVKKTASKRPTGESPSKNQLHI